MKNLILFIPLLVASTAINAQRKYTPPVTPKEELYKTYGISLFRGVEGTYFDLQHDNITMGAIAYLNILDWLQGRVAGLQIYRINNMPVPFIRNAPATVFVDEMRMDASILNVLPVADIALIKVMKSPFVAAWGSPGGAIAIYTKRGGAEEDEMES